MVGISGRALGKITSSFMVITSDNQKTNLGLSLSEVFKVIDYSKKQGRNWDYSEKAVELLKEYKASSVLFCCCG
jgi:5'-3' exoribonuclease 1